jgi:putative photosynthetic complex assembly protein 2
LAHIGSFFRHAPMNLLFPFSVTASTICAVIMTQQALGAGDNSFNATGYALLATMMVLAILEHWFLVLPISATRIWNAMWQWSLVSRGGNTAKTPKTHQRPLPIATEATIGGHS